MDRIYDILAFGHVLLVFVVVFHYKHERFLKKAKLHSSAYVYSLSYKHSVYKHIQGKAKSTPCTKHDGKHRFLQRQKKLKNEEQNSITKHFVVNYPHFLYYRHCHLYYHVIYGCEIHGSNIYFPPFC